MKTRQDIETMLEIVQSQRERFEKQLSEDLIHFYQGRIIQDEVRQSELRFECALTQQETLKWVLNIPDKEPF